MLQKNQLRLSYVNQQILGNPLVLVDLEDLLYLYHL